MAEDFFCVLGQSNNRTAYCEILYNLDDARKRIKELSDAQPGNYLIFIAAGDGSLVDIESLPESAAKGKTAIVAA